METSPVLRALTASLLQKLSRKSCQFRRSGCHNYYIIAKIKKNQASRKWLVSITISRASYSTFFRSPLRPLLSQLSHVTDLPLIYRYISVPLFFLPLLFFLNVLYPGKKNVGYSTLSRLDDHQLTVIMHCQKYTTRIDMYLRSTTAMMRLDDRW